jgi:hypothetical protein
LGERVADLNNILVDYCQWCYNEGKASWVPKYAILAFQLQYRHLKGHLRPAWDSMFAWTSLEGTGSRIPLRLEIIQGLCYYSIMAGLWFDRPRALPWLAFGIALRTGFHGLLRPGELFDLQRQAVMLPGPGMFRGLSVGVVAIEEPKNRGPGARQQVRMIRDPTALAWLQWLAAPLPSTGLLWPFGRVAFCRMLHESLQFFGLQSLGFSPGSLRAGGATYLLECGVPVGEIKFAGGWSAERSLSHYLQQAEAAITLLQMPAQAARRLEFCLEHLSFLEVPPALCLPQLLATWTRQQPPQPSLKPAFSSRH